MAPLQQPLLQQVLLLKQGLLLQQGQGEGEEEGRLKGTAAAAYFSSRLLLLLCIYGEHT